jgi:hypothetical protein
VLGGEAVTVDALTKRLLPAAGEDGVTLPDGLIAQRDKGEGALKRSLGRHLSRLNGRIFSGRKLRPAGEDTHAKVRRWQLSPLNNPANPAVVEDNPAANPARGGER